jgi:hypothetical protein
MAIAFDVKETREYILEADRKLPPEQQTIFILGTLDSSLAGHINDASIDFQMNDKGPDREANIQWRRAFRQLQLVRFGLKGWSNLFDRQGKEIRFDPKDHTKSYAVSNVGNREGLTDRALDLIKPYIRELAKQINEANWLDEEEEKNSDAPSQ